jgi:HK97 family phage major capsid protein
MKLTRSNLTMLLIGIVAIAAFFALLGHPIIPPDALAGAGMIPMAIGDIDLKKVTELVEKQGAAWEEFKKTNDERIDKLAKGESVEALESKLAKMNDALTEAQGGLKELAAKANRPGRSAETDEKEAKSLERFNAKAKAAAIESGKTFAPLSAEGYANYKAAVAGYIRRGNESLTPEQAKAINVGTGPQGGYLVGEEMEAGIERVVGRYSAMRQLARVIPIGSAAYKKLVKTRGLSGATRGNENTAASTGTTPQWVELTFTPGTYLSDNRISMESLEDSVQNVEADLMEEIGIEFAEMEGADFITGDGVNGPRGIHSYTMVENASYEWGKIGHKVSGHASSFAASNPSDALIDLQHALKRQYRGNANWSMNDSTLGQIRKFKDGNGLYMWAPSGIQLGAAGQLLGHAVVTDDFMPDLGAGTFPIAFADFQRAYYVVDRKGISVLRDPFTAAPHVKFVARRRVGGGIANFEAIKLLKCST